MRAEEMAGRVQEALSARGLAGKRDYVRSLEQRRDEQAVALLVGCLSDESGYLRELAEAALTTLGDRGGPLLLPLLRQGLWFARASAARTLGRMYYAPAAGELLGMCEDRVDYVAREAATALATIGRHGGGARIAWELHHVPAERRRTRLERLRARDAALADRVERLLRAERLMTHPDPDQLRDDAPLVRVWEERTWREQQRIGQEPGEGTPEPLGAGSGTASGADASAR